MAGTLAHASPYKYKCMYQAKVVSEHELQAYRPHDQQAVKALPTEPCQSLPYALLDRSGVTSWRVTFAMFTDYRAIPEEPTEP